MAGKLEGSLEENVLTLLCWNEMHAPNLVLQLTPDLFSTRSYRRIAEVAFDYIGSYRKPPQIHLWDIMERELRQGDEGKLLTRTLDAMKGLHESMQPSFVMDGLNGFIEQRRLLTAIEKAADLAHGGSIAEAIAALAEGSDYAAPDGNSGMWFSDANAMLGFLDNSDEDRFPIGIEEFDRLGVQLMRKAMFLFMAPPKRGKSWFLIHCGKAGLQYRKNVLHISLENSAELTAQRYLQAIFALKQNEHTDIKVSKLARGSNNKVDNISLESLIKSAAGNPIEATTAENRGKIAKRITTLKHRARLRIECFPSGSLTISMLNALLDRLEREDKFKPDIIIVDYPDLMALDRANMRISLGSIFVSLRGIATQRNAAMVVATQGGRDAANSQTTRATQVSEDYSKVMTADTIVTYSQTSKEKKLGLARLLVDAARAAKDGFMILITQAYGIGQFCLDSTFMSDDIEQSVERLSKGENE